jgi:hypothetical protein
MMQSYLLAAFTAARRAASPIISACYFDLQIIQGPLQVKTPPAACAILRISLGFKQLARIWAEWIGAVLRPIREKS